MTDFDKVRAILDAAGTFPETETVVYAEQVAFHLAPELLAVAEAFGRALDALDIEIGMHPYDADVPTRVLAARDEGRAALDALHAKMKETL